MKRPSRQAFRASRGKHLGGHPSTGDNSLGTGFLEEGGYGGEEEEEGREGGVGEGGRGGSGLELSTRGQRCCYRFL